MVAHMSPRSWWVGPSPDWQSRPSTPLESYWHLRHRNKCSCCNIRHSCSLHNTHKHNHLVAWHHKGCKVFCPWFRFAVCPSSLCIKIWDKPPSQGEGEQVPLSPALPLQKRCQLWQLSPPPWLRSLLRGQRMLHVLQLEEFQFPYGFCQHGLSDHAASLIQSHIDCQNSCSLIKTSINSENFQIQEITEKYSTAMWPGVWLTPLCKCRTWAAGQFLPLWVNKH